MARMIHKLDLRMGTQIVMMPPHAKVLAVQSQDGCPVIWYEFELAYADRPDALCERKFLVVDTGDPFETIDAFDLCRRLVYIGTAQTFARVVHLYELAFY